MIQLVFCGMCLALGDIETGRQAKQVEHRDFQVFVDGRKCGAFQMTITDQDDGTTVMVGQADVRVSFLVYRYSYSYRGTETWKSKRLQRLESTANDDGKKMSLHAFLEGGMLRIRPRGKERVSAPDVWTTTYWQLPETRLHNGPLLLLDADTGRELKARLQFVEFKPMSVSGKTQRCQHFRVTGENLLVDLWYDTDGRLVRQESMEDGHRTLVDLLSVRSTPDTSTTP